MTRNGSSAVRTDPKGRRVSWLRIWHMAVAAILLLGLQAEAADTAATKQAIARGANYLRSLPGNLEGGRAMLRAYALLKADGNENEPIIAAAIADIVKRCSGETYIPQRSDQIYACGIEAMLLADVDPEKHKPALEKIAKYLVAEQREDGAFSYRSPQDPGDISVTQYAALGLWACERAGVEVPRQVWDKIAIWHMKSQMSDGGFQYGPGSSMGVTGAQPNLTMTAAGAASMAIANLVLHSQDYTPRRAGGGAAPRDPNDPLGVLNVRTPAPGGAAQQEATGPYRPQASKSDLDSRTGLAVAWASKNFTPEYRLDLRMYNYYTLERMGALTEVETLGGKNWFDECASRLFASQEQNGSWTSSFYDTKDSYVVGTSFGVLFLSRSTAKLLNRTPPPDPIGGGLQVGGRGLPDDLASVTMQDGRVAKDESLGPLDDLLKSLEAAAGDDLFNLQTQIVKKIQLGDRSELIGQTDRLVELLDYPAPDIRRTALWALARSDDLTMARHMVAALEDPDRDVLIEAHNALCWLSRRPNAFDIPPDPLGELPPDATDQQKEQAVAKWRANALKNWGNWYLKMCTYEERNTPFAHDLARKIGLR
jgi:hypothetical protein